MRGKCPKCGAVFAISPGLSLIHVGPWRYTKCPACGKSSMMNNFVSDPITWPPEAKEEDKDQTSLTDEELKQKRLEDSKYEDARDSSS